LTGRAREREREKREREERARLSNKDFDKFSELLRKVTLRRSSVREVMGFALDMAEASEEIVQVMTDSLTLKTTPAPVKVARLFVISDILHNSSASVRNASSYRQLFQDALPQVFKGLADTFHGLESRLSANSMRQKVLRVLEVWGAWSLYPPLFLMGLESSFVRPSLDQKYVEELMEIDEADLDVEELKRKCKQAGLLTDSGGKELLRRLHRVNAYVKLKTRGITPVVPVLTSAAAAAAAAASRDTASSAVPGHGRTDPNAAAHAGASVAAHPVQRKKKSAWLEVTRGSANAMHGPGVLGTGSVDTADNVDGEALDGEDMDGEALDDIDGAIMDDDDVDGAPMDADLMAPANASAALARGGAGVLQGESVAMAAVEEEAISGSSSEDDVEDEGPGRIELSSNTRVAGGSLNGSSSASSIGGTADKPLSRKQKERMEARRQMLRAVELEIVTLRDELEASKLLSTAQIDTRCAALRKKLQGEFEAGQLKRAKVDAEAEAKEAKEKEEKARVQLKKASEALRKKLQNSSWASKSQRKAASPSKKGKNRKASQETSSKSKAEMKSDVSSVRSRGAKASAAPPTGSQAGKKLKHTTAEQSQKPDKVSAAGATSGSKKKRPESMVSIQSSGTSSSRRKSTRSSTRKKAEAEKAKRKSRSRSRSASRSRSRSVSRKRRDKSKRRRSASSSSSRSRSRSPSRDRDRRKEKDKGRKRTRSRKSRSRSRSKSRDRRKKRRRSRSRSRSSDKKKSSSSRPSSTSKRKRDKRSSRR